MADPSPPVAVVDEEPGPGGETQPGLRVVTARGGVVNAAFLAGAEGLVALQGLLATALLGPSEIGLYGVVTTTAMTIVALRRVGIDEAFVQEAAADEEAEFQRALTVELALGLAAALAIAAPRPGAGGGLRRRPAARADARRHLSPAGVRAPGAAVGVLQAHGVRAPAHAAGDRAARHRGGHAAAAARRRGRVGARHRPGLREPGRRARGLAGLAVPAAPAARRGRRAPLPALLLAGVRHRGGRAARRPGPGRAVRAARWVGGGRLGHAGGHARPLLRPGRPDPGHDDLPGDRPRARAR